MAQKQVVSLYIIIISFCIFPSLFYSFGASSLGFGLLICSIGLIFSNMNLIKPSIIHFKKGKVFLILYISVIIHFLLLLLLLNNINFNVNKFIISILSLPIIIQSSLIFLMRINFINKENFSLLISLIMATLLIIFLFQLIIDISFFIDKPKAILFFAEPSHFAIVFSPFFLYSILTMDKVRSSFLLFILLICLSIVNNATLFVLFLLSFIFFCIRFRINVKLIIFTNLIVIILLVTLNIDYSYFIERFIPFEGNYNMSILVYLSGWERALKLCIDYSLIGVGFQQFGYEPLEGFYYSKLSSIGGAGLNIYDGSTLGSKILGEFGLIGFLLLLLYFFYLFKKIIYILIVPNKFSSITLFFSCVYLTFIIYLFIRGMGYFSDTFFLFLTSILYFIDKEYFAMQHEYKSQ